MDLYAAHERVIFVFESPESGTLRYDPLELDRNLLRACRKQGVDLDATMAMLAPPDGDDTDDVPDAIHSEQVLDALLALTPCVADAFGVPKFDPNTGLGWPASDLAKLFVAFIFFKAELKKKADLSLASSPSTDGPAAGSEGEPSAGLAVATISTPAAASLTPSSAV